jgi:hypothetical protein
MAECNEIKFSIDSGARLRSDKEDQQVDASEYKRVICCLRYLLHTRQDLSCLVGVDSRFMEKPTVMHMRDMKQTRYLKVLLILG